MQQEINSILKAGDKNANAGKRVFKTYAAARDARNPSRFKGIDIILVETIRKNLRTTLLVHLNGKFTSKDFARAISLVNNYLRRFDAKVI